MCEFFAPSIFKLDDDLIVQYEESPDTTLAAELGEAIAGCPTHAISLVSD
jgi:ferredoxin